MFHIRMKTQSNNLVEKENIKNQRNLDWKILFRVVDLVRPQTDERIHR